MVKKRVEKKGNMYYARIYTDDGSLLDSLGFGRKREAVKYLKRIPMFRLPLMKGEELTEGFDY